VIDIGILLIVDEIQTEFGRVNNGKELFAIEESGNIIVIVSD